MTHSGWKRWSYTKELAGKKNKEALQKLGSLYLAENSEDKLVKLFNKKNRSEMEILADIYMQQGYYEKASSIYREPCQTAMRILFPYDQPV